MNIGDLIIGSLEFLLSAYLMKCSEKDLIKLYYDYPLPWDKIERAHSAYGINICACTISALNLTFKLLELYTYFYT